MAIGWAGGRSRARGTLSVCVCVCVCSHTGCTAMMSARHWYWNTDIYWEFSIFGFGISFMASNCVKVEPAVPSMDVLLQFQGFGKQDKCPWMFTHNPGVIRATEHWIVHLSLRALNLAMTAGLSVLSGSVTPGTRTPGGVSGCYRFT